MKNIRIFLAENFPFLMVKFSVYLNRRVFVMLLKVKNKTRLRRLHRFFAIHICWLGHFSMKFYSLLSYAEEGFCNIIIFNNKICHGN